MSRLLRACLGCVLLACCTVDAYAMHHIPDLIVRQVARILEDADADPAAAIQALEDLIQRRRRSADIQAYIVRQKAALLMREQQFEQAAEDMGRVLEGQAGSFEPQLRLMLGQTLLVLEDYDGGLAELEVWAEHQATPDPTGLFLIGYGYLRTDRLDLAIERLESAMAALEEVPRSHWIELLAYAYARAGRPADAQRLVAQLIERDPGQARWWRQLAAVLLLVEDVSRGTAALSIAEQIKPDTYANTRRLSRFLAHAGLPVDAAELLQAGLADQDAAGSATADDYLLLAEMWVLAREFDPAVAALQEAEQRGTGDGKPALLLGQLYLHWERYEEASLALERAVTGYAPTEAVPAQVYYLLAIAHINLEQYTPALDAVYNLADDEDYAARGAGLERFIANRRREAQAAASQ